MGASALEKFRRLIFSATPALVLALSLTSACSSKFLKVEDPQRLNVDDEFTKSIEIVVPEAAPSESSDAPTAPAEDRPVVKAPSVTPPPKPTPKPPVKKAPTPRPVKGSRPAPVSPTARLPKVPAARPEVPTKREPDLEDSVGFKGRRPLVDPFRVGEKVIHDVSYFKVSAGQLTLEVGPYAMVNGRKAYNFITSIETYPRFSSLVYAVEDKAVTLLDYETLVPRVFTLHVRETGQLKEARSIFDFEKLQATYWEKKVTEKRGPEEKKMEWEILPYSQNVFSAIFYMRLFRWEPGKEYSFRVADDGENIVFKGRAVRRETLTTEVGIFPAVVVKPEITVKGVFKPMGDIFIWLSDDERRLVLRIESKIKIGTLVSEVIRIEPGRGGE